MCGERCSHKDFHLIHFMNYDIFFIMGFPCVSSFQADDDNATNNWLFRLIGCALCVIWCAVCSVRCELCVVRSA